MMNIDQKAFSAIATDKELHLYSTKVILFLLSVLSFEHWKKVNQTSLGKELQIDQSNLSKTIRFLKQKNMVIEQNRHYRLVQWW